MARRKAKKRKGSRAQRTTVRGPDGRRKTYESIRAGCVALGLFSYEPAIYGRIRRGWSVQRAFDKGLENANQRKISLNLPGGTRSFPSLIEACRETGQEYFAVRGRLQRGWTDDEAFEVVARCQDRKPNPKAVRVQFDHGGKSYDFPSRAEACRFFGMNPSVIRHRVEDLHWAYPEAFELSPRREEQTRPWNGESKPYGRVYMMTCAVTAMSYVGQTKRSLEERLAHHHRDAGKKRNQVSSASLAAAINRYGIASFTIKELKRCSSQSALDSVERELIKEHGTLSPKGYNLNAGGGGGAAHGIPVELDGQWFPSRSSIARAHGIKPSNFLLRLRKGWTLREALGIDKRPGKRWDVIVQVTVNGRLVEFRSPGDAARHFGLKPATVCERLDAGWPIEEALELKAHQYKNKSDPLSVFDGRKIINYPSISAASRARGLDPAQVWTRLHKLGWTPEQALEFVKKPRGHAIEITGPKGKKEYPSEQAAAKANGIHPDTFRKRLKQGWSPEQAADIVPPPRKKHHNAKKVKMPTEGGTVVFHSHAEAEKFLRLKRGTISRRLDLGWTEKQALGLASPPKNPRPRRPWVFQHEGKTRRFRSDEEASKHFGLDRRTVSKRRSDGCTCRQALGLDPIPRQKGDRRPVTVAFKGKSRHFPSMKAASKHYGVHLATLKYRLDKGWPPSRAVGLE